MSLTVERKTSGWYVSGVGVKAMVYGLYAPRGYICGLGSKKHRKSILEAVEGFRREAEGGEYA